MSEDKNRPATLGDVEGSEHRVIEEMRGMQTEILRAFHGWARSMEIRVRSSGSNVATLDERLALAEERISELERHKAS